MIFFGISRAYEFFFVILNFFWRRVVAFFVLSDDFCIQIRQFIFLNGFVSMEISVFNFKFFEFAILLVGYRRLSLFTQSSILILGEIKFFFIAKYGAL